MTQQDYMLFDPALHEVAALLQACRDQLGAMRSL
jgi:hypothetical protein